MEHSAQGLQLHLSIAIAFLASPLSVFRQSWYTGCWTFQNTEIPCGESELPSLVWCSRWSTMLAVRARVAHSAVTATSCLMGCLPLARCVLLIAEDAQDRHVRNEGRRLDAKQVLRGANLLLY